MDPHMDEFMKFQAEMAKIAESNETKATEKPAEVDKNCAREAVGPAARDAAGPSVRAAATTVGGGHSRATIAREAERVPAGPTAMKPPPPPPSVYFNPVTAQGRGPAVKKDFKPIGKSLARKAGGERWEDSSLAEWPENDFRIFVGDLGNECNDDMLARAFAKYPSFAKAKVVADKANPGKNKGYGFVSFLDINCYAKAMKEMAGKFIGNRPVKLRKSAWNERTDDKRQVKGLGSKGKGKPMHKRKHIAIGPSINYG